MKYLGAFLLMLLLIMGLAFPLVPAAAREPAKIPPLLQPWTDWVLHDHEREYLCVPFYNDAHNVQCKWPTALSLNLHDGGGDFSQTWLIRHESWISLPGSERYWPQEFLVNGEPALLVNRESRPQLKLAQGTYSISGKFQWQRLPEQLPIAPDSALVALRVNGETIPFPNIDPQGRLWLQANGQAQEKIEDRLKLQAFRLVEDEIPATLTLHLDLDVAGTAREIMLGPLFSPPNFIPLAVQSALPAKLENDGRLRLQVRPGNWQLQLTMRHLGPLATLPFQSAPDGFSPREEVWVFAAHNNLRIVEVTGARAIDPQQTSLPDMWRHYPAYMMSAGQSLVFKEIKRGDPLPAPDQLRLQRRLWLRFDGSGYTIEDTISGVKNTHWRLEVDPLLQLGRVTVDGVEQFITQQPGSAKSGVELRNGRLALVAESTYRDSITTLLATGYEHDFQQAAGELYLPPGWRLVHATGIDHISNTWLKSWSLLDLFLVLISTIAVAKLYSRPLALIALLTLTLTFQEPGAPRGVWLALLLGVALLRQVEAGKFKKALQIYQALVIIALILTGIPFAINQLRVGLYPQLEKPYQAMAEMAPRQAGVLRSPATGGVAMMVGEEAAPQEQRSMEMDMMRKKNAPPVPQKMEYGEPAAVVPESLPSALSDVKRSAVEQYDPAMIQQTGPGLPNWQWNRVDYSWTGPVDHSQRLIFFLLGPTTNLVLAFLRVGLLSLLVLGLFSIGIGSRRGRTKGAERPDRWGWTTRLFPVLLLLCLICGPHCRASEIPSPEMFEELRSRLLHKDECFPNCVDVATLKAEITPELLTLTLQVNAQVEMALPLPGDAKQWLAQKVLRSGQPVEGLLRANEALWLLLPAGRHELTLQGLLPKQNSVQLPLPLKPHRVTVVAEGWSVEGVHEDGVADNQLQFKRIVKDEAQGGRILETGVLPPFVTIERTLRLGLVWKVETRVQRVTPPGSAVVLKIPLLPQESVVTDGIRVEEGQVLLNLDANQNFLQWESFLEIRPELLLRHPPTDQWSETWRVDVSPIFHMETEGIAVILHQVGERWFPTWQPWPGEEVKLKITRPLGVSGQTLTIEKSQLEVRPGGRDTDAQLALTLRCSQGGHHTLTLPEAAQLQEVTIGGVIQPIRQEGRRVPLPITPGLQQITLKWRQNTGMSLFYQTPEIALGVESVNINIDLHVPANRWPLFMGGITMGPAVLFWSVVLILLLAAWGLAKTGLTPLKFHQWFLLGIGMSQSSLVGCLLVVGWLLALDVRARKIEPSTLNRRLFNSLQVGLVALSVIALCALITAINQGLLGHPDMNIAGNGSYSSLLRWYQDHGAALLPRPWVVSIPMYCYRLAMLAWALWISFTLISLLKWGWRSFTHPLAWRSGPKKAAPGAATGEGEPSCAASVHDNKGDYDPNRNG